MNRTIETRLRKLEASVVPPASNEIPIYCDGEANFGRTLDALIARGEVEAEDRPRCVWWLRQTVPVGFHEAWLESLEAR